MIEAALSNARRGWPVFPLHSVTADGQCTCGKSDCIDNRGKHPRTPHGFKDASCDDEQIREWWTQWPDSNVGIATGKRSGLVVLDVDPPKSGDESLVDLEKTYGKLPESVEALTGGGGRHLYFQYPQNGLDIRISASTLGSGLDVRGEGGYVVAPPSLHKSGCIYSWEVSSHPEDVAIAPLPDWLLTLLQSPKPTKTVAVNGQDLSTIPEGQRNTTLTSLAGTMRRRGMSEEAITAALLSDNTKRCQPPLPEIEVQKIANSVSSYSAVIAQSQKGDSGVSIQLRSFANIKPEPVEFAWEGRIAVKAFNLLVGDPGLGKSTIAFDLAAKWTRGEVAGDWYRQPVHVLIASCEDSASTTIRPRLEIAGADLSMVHLLTFERDTVTGGLSIPEDLPQLKTTMLEVGARVLIIDPVMGHLGDVNSYKDQNIRKALGPLTHLAESIDGVVLGIMHLNKRECSSIVAKVGGTVGFVAAARSVLLVAQDPESETPGNGVLVHAKCNLAPHVPTVRFQIESVSYEYESTQIRTSRIVWGPVAEHIHSEDVLRTDFQGSDEPGQKGEAKEWLWGYLEDGAKPSEEVYKMGKRQGDFSTSTLKRAKKELKIKSNREGFGANGQWMWALPKEDHSQKVDPLWQTPCKNGQNSKDLLKEGQGFSDDPLCPIPDPLSQLDSEPTLYQEEVIDLVNPDS